jgi:hypothetical protein
MTVTAVEDQQSVQALGAHGADEASRSRSPFSARIGVFTIRMPSLREHLSKAPPARA